MDRPSGPALAGTNPAGYRCCTPVAPRL